MIKGLPRYGTELFSVPYSSKNIPQRNFVPRKNTVRHSAIRNFFRTVIPHLSVSHSFNHIMSRKIQQEAFAIAFLKKFSCIFILLLRESDQCDQCVIRACLDVASHLSTTPRWGNPAKCLYQRHNK